MIDLVAAKFKETQKNLPLRACTDCERIVGVPREDDIGEMKPTGMITCQGMYQDMALLQGQGYFSVGLKVG